MVSDHCAQKISAYIRTCKLRVSQFKFCKKNENTCVSDNNPFAGKRMGRHQYQTAFINIKNRWSKILAYVYESVGAT